uniref:Ig-like domain-containing protein n=1 Tax=Lates calcarifer TaxID=8187 RepID=A0A4W6E3L0_LATCA
SYLPPVLAFLCVGQKQPSSPDCHFILFFPERKNPPVFTKKPSEHIEDMEGKLVKMEGRVSGSQPMSVSWFKDNKEIYTCLEISQASRHDAGDYLCKATNDAGTLISHTSVCPVFSFSHHFSF